MGEAEKRKVILRSRSRSRKIVTEIITIAPSQAALILEHQNYLNRTLVEERAKTLAKLMTDGLWKMNGDTIRFAIGSVRLMDGQHRLRACVISGIPLTVIAVFNLPDDAMPTIDTGGGRTAAQALNLDHKQRFGKGFKNANVTAAVVRLLHAYDADPQMPAVNRGNWGKMAPIRVVGAVDDYPRLDESVAIGVAGAKGFSRTGMTATVMGFAHYVFARMNRKRADEFMEGLITGAELAIDAPAFALRKRLSGNTSTNRRDGPLGAFDAIYMIFQAWRYFWSGVPLQKSQTAKATKDGSRPALPDLSKKVTEKERTPVVRSKRKGRQKSTV